MMLFGTSYRLFLPPQGHAGVLAVLFSLAHYERCTFRLLPAPKGFSAEQGFGGKDSYVYSGPTAE